MRLKFPTISQYLQSLGSPHGLFRTLEDFDVDKDHFDDLRFCSGNNAVVARIFQDGRARMLKCYIREPLRVREIYNYLASLDTDLIIKAKLLPDEIFVYNEFEKGSFFPVVVGEWVDGESLENRIRRLAQQDDREGLKQLSEQFSSFALELLRQPWAHGDIKPENIIITLDGRLRLIDCDAMFIPTLATERAVEVGTEGYQHPSRDGSHYYKSIDDYPIALIAVTIAVLADNPSLLPATGETTLFDPKEILAGRSSLFSNLIACQATKGNIPLYRLLMALASPTLAIPKIESILEGRIVKTDGIIIPAREGDHWGFESEHGEMVIAAVFDWVQNFRESVAAVSLMGVCHFIDRQGVIALNCADYEAINSFSEGRAGIQKNGLWGFIDHVGNIVIEPQFEVAAPFREGFAAVKQNGLYGYINTDGQWVIEPKYDYARSVNNLKAEILTNETYSVIDFD